MKTDVHINLYRETGYSQQRYNVAAIHPRGPLSPLKKPSSFALLPYVQTTYNRISRMLVERKIISFLGPVKDDLELTTPGCVQPSPVSVCQVCIGQTGRSSETCVTNKSGTSESQSPTNRRWLNADLTITTHITDTKSGYWTDSSGWRLLDLHPNNTNRENDPILSGSWKPLISSFKGRRWAPRLVCMLTFLSITKLFYACPLLSLVLCSLTFYPLALNCSRVHVDPSFWCLPSSLPYCYIFSFSFLLCGSPSSHIIIFSLLLQTGSHPVPLLNYSLL
jgi:hypothetical protein